MVKRDSQGKFLKGHTAGKRFEDGNIPWNKGTKGKMNTWNKGSGKWFMDRGYLKIRMDDRIISAQDFVWCNTPGNLSYIPKGFVIHHIDGVRLNNDPDNLFLISRSDHSKLHWKYRRY